MIDAVKEQLLEYIRENNPEILFQLGQQGGLKQYLSQKLSAAAELIETLKKEGHPVHLIETLCFEQITADLRPSKFNYIRNLLIEEFEETYVQLYGLGVLQYEIINMINYCISVFEDLRFSEETADNRFTRYAISGMISEYLESNSAKENVSNGLQQSAEAKR